MFGCVWAVLMFLLVCVRSLCACNLNGFSFIIIRFDLLLLLGILKHDLIMLLCVDCCYAWYVICCCCFVIVDLWLLCSYC